MADGIDVVRAIPDPVGIVTESWTRPNGMTIERVRVPLGGAEGGALVLGGKSPGVPSLVALSISRKKVALTCKMFNERRKSPPFPYSLLSQSN